MSPNQFRILHNSFHKCGQLSFVLLFQCWLHKVLKVWNCSSLKLLSIWIFILSYSLFCGRQTKNPLFTFPSKNCKSSMFGHSSKMAHFCFWQISVQTKPCVHFKLKFVYGFLKQKSSVFDKKYISPEVVDPPTQSKPNHSTGY